MELLNCFGLIDQLYAVDRGYTRVTIATNIPFKTKRIKFNVWDMMLLRNDALENFKIGDEVKVQYSHRNGFPRLMNMRSARIDNCPVCFTSLEGIDAQQIECDGCRLIPEEEHKKRVNESMKLTGCALKKYQVSNGYRLEVYSPEENKSFAFVVFENSALYDNVPDMKVGNSYRVIGWLSPNGRFLDVVDIDQV